MRAEIRRLKTVTADDTDVHLAAAGPIHSEECFLFGVNPANGFLARQAPVVGIADVRDVLVRAHLMRLVDAGDLEFFHAWPPSACTGAARWLIVFSSASVSVKPSLYLR